RSDSYSPSSSTARLARNPARVARCRVATRGAARRSRASALRGLARAKRAENLGLFAARRAARVSLRGWLDAVDLLSSRVARCRTNTRSIHARAPMHRALRAVSRAARDDKNLALEARCNIRATRKKSFAKCQVFGQTELHKLAKFVQISFRSF